MFFRDFEFVLRKAADVISVRWLEENARPHSKATHIVQLVGDEVCHLDQESFREINDYPRSFIGASSGTILLEDVETEDGGSEIDRVPVIAWAISPAGKPAPVTPTGRHEQDFWFVLLPDGTVNGSDGVTYATEQEYLIESGKS